jgi:hypothetical protein
LSLPKNAERFEGRTSEEWADLYLKSCENLAKKLIEVRAMGANQEKNGDSVCTANLAKAELNNASADSNQQKMVDTSATTDLVQAELNFGKAKSDTHAEFVNPVDTSFAEQEHGECETSVLDFSRCEGAFMLPYEFCAKEIDEHPKEENIAKPSSVEEEHLSEETQDPVKKEDKNLENHQEVEQDIVQVVQRPYSPNVIDFDNKKILIRSDQAESTIGKNVVIDQERKIKSAPKPKPTVKQLLDKYTSRKANNMFSRLEGAKHHRSPSRPGRKLI